MRLREKRNQCARAAQRRPRVNRLCPTALVSLDLFRRGLSPDEIATERGLSSGTVMGHLIAQMELGEQLEILSAGSS